MTGPSVPYRVPDAALAREEPEVTSAGADEPAGRQCARCGAVGTHYLTCPGLRLPSGYRHGHGPGREKH